MWQGIKSITDYKGNNSHLTNPANPSLPDELNHLFARLDRDNNQPITKLSLHGTPQHEVRRTLSHLNPNKTSGLDGIPGRVLKHCAGELVAVFTNLFNTSLEKAHFPTWLKLLLLSSGPGPHINQVLWLVLTHKEKHPSLWTSTNLSIEQIGQQGMLSHWPFIQHCHTWNRETATYGWYLLTTAPSSTPSLQAHWLQNWLT